MLLASLASISVANAALTNITASDATYVRSSEADTVLHGGTTNVANDNGSNHRVAYYTYDISAISGTITDITWSLTENAGGGTAEYQVFGIDSTISLTLLTWDIAVTDGHLSSNRPTGTSLGTFNSVNGSSSYDVTLSNAFFDGDADGLISLAIVDNDSGITGIGWTNTPVLKVTSVPEPSSAALL